MEVPPETEQAREPTCELCLRGEFDRPEPGRRFVRHHKKLKGAGGTSDPLRDDPSNLARLHDECHLWVHANPRAARELGLIVSRNGAQQIRPWRPEGVGAA